MINYRVENLEALIELLKKDGVTVTDSIQSVDYGKFVHIMDLENNKIELWEPNDIEFKKLGVRMGVKTIKKSIHLKIFYAKISRNKNETKLRECRRFH